MNKKDIKLVVDELRNNISYDNVDTSPMTGCGLSGFKKGKHIRKEVIVMHLRWQCLYINGNIDESVLSDELFLLKKNKIIMV